MIKEAIVLAGGLGTRLREAVPELPKCLAPIDGKPFLSYLIRYYLSQGVERFIFSLGYRHEMIVDMLKKEFPSLSCDMVIEQEPLGTGGAIAFAMDKTIEEDVIILNGDTFYSIDLERFSEQHLSLGGECTLALKPMKDFYRYGVVEIDTNGTITSFKEKQHYAEGLINGGVYAVHVPSFLQYEFPSKFSFEKDYLEKQFETGSIKGHVEDGYFIDIGIPQDFNRAQIELPAQIKF